MSEQQEEGRRPVTAVTAVVPPAIPWWRAILEVAKMWRQLQGQVAVIGGLDARLEVHSVAIRSLLSQVESERKEAIRMLLANAERLEKKLTAALARRDGTTRAMASKIRKLENWEAKIEGVVSDMAGLRAAFAELERKSVTADPEALEGLHERLGALLKKERILTKRRRRVAKGRS